MSSLDPAVAALLKDPTTLIPAVVQDSTTNEVLMLAHMNSESLALTLSTGKATYWSRSRNELWVKGATSGHLQKVISVAWIVMETHYSFAWSKQVLLAIPVKEPVSTPHWHWVSNNEY